MRKEGDSTCEQDGSVAWFNNKEPMTIFIRGSCSFVQTWSQVSQQNKLNELLTGLFVVQLMLIKQCVRKTGRCNNHCQKYQFNLLWKDGARPAGCQYHRNPNLRCVINSIGNRQIPWQNHAFLFQTCKALALLNIFRLIQNADLKPIDLKFGDHFTCCRSHGNPC